MRRLVLLMTAVGAVFAGVVGSALGAPSVFLCVSTTTGGAVTSGGSTGTCGAGTSSVALPSEKAEQEKLISILPHLKYLASGVGGKPTIQFSGVNLQVISGATGKETAINGLGNLVIGYDEEPGTQTGSNNLVLGTFGQSFTSYGGLLAGAKNTVNGESASVVGGRSNTAGPHASVTGGESNKAKGEEATVSGGGGGEASGPLTSVTGGRLGKAAFRASTVLGGLEEVTEAEFGVTP